MWRLKDQTGRTGGTYRTGWRVPEKLRSNASTKGISYSCFRRRTMTLTLWKKRLFKYCTIHAIVFYFKFLIRCWKKRKSALMFKSVDFNLMHCLLFVFFGWPASRSLNRWSLNKARWMHIWWRLWVSTQILSMVTAWCGPYMIFACQLSCYFTVIDIQSLPAIL